MQAYSKKFPKGSDEANGILKVTAEKGQWTGQEFAGIKGYLAWKKWLEYATGNPNFGLCPTNPDNPWTDSELLRTKAHNALGKLLNALDVIAEGEARKLEAERQLKTQLWKYLEAKRNMELKFYEVRE